MRKIQWILQNNLIKESDLLEIKNALNESNISFEEVKVIPFSDELPIISNNNNFKIFYGSTTLILNAYQNTNYKEGIFYDKETFSLKNYFNKWKINMLNFDSEILTFNEILNKGYKEGNWFIRPIYDDKSFSGRVMNYEEIEHLENSLADSNNPYLNEETLVAISKPKSIPKEWRHFIVNKKVVSSSRYAEYGKVSKSSDDVPTDLLDFVNERCQEYVPNDIFVMDTSIHNDKYKIVECNCFNDTGFYKHNVSKIIKEVNKHIEKKTTHNKT